MYRILTATNNNKGLTVGTQFTVGDHTYKVEYRTSRYIVTKAV